MIPTALAQSVPARPDTVRPVAAPYPSRVMVAQAAALFAAERNPDRSVELLPVTAGGARSWARTLEFGFSEPWRDRELVEGPQWRVEVGPGVVAVRRRDPARAERSAQRASDDARVRANLAAVRLRREGPEAADGSSPRDEPAPARTRVVRAWSPRSRSRMVEAIASLDTAPLFAREGWRVGMVTLTYPGDWLAVAPTAEASRRHLLALRKRFERFYGVPLVCIWKREFQRRGAPHWHLGMPCPEGRHKGLTFRAWLSRTWAEIVGAESCGGALVECRGSCEFHRHEVAGTGVDFAEGARFSDPRRFGVYFSKHGSFAAKDYQNEAPAEWEGSVGRFWGYWGLDKAVHAVPVAPDVALAVVRAARRWDRARGVVVPVRRWRQTSRGTLRVQAATGEIEAGGPRWRKRKTTVRSVRLRQGAGYMVVNSGPAFASELARVASGVQTVKDPARVIAHAGRVRVVYGPAGFLP